MKIIHAVITLPRLVDDALAARLRVMPAVLLTGARQTGKRTLVEKRAQGERRYRIVEKLAQGERRYRTIDDCDALDAARRDPEALLVGDDPLTLDEVQREPRLMSAVKRAIATTTAAPGASCSPARRTLCRSTRPGPRSIFVGAPNACPTSHAAPRRSGHTTL